MKQLDLFKTPPDASGSRDAGSAGAPPPPSSQSAGLVVCSGALAAEAALLARIDELAAEARRDPALLAAPVRVVVPSRSLRRHVAARLVREGAGRALAGVSVQTLHGVACEVLERAGEAAPHGGLLFETLVEREARREAVLRRGLGELVDGFLAVAAGVADLLDAGLEPAHAEGVDEALAADGPAVSSRAEVERARALVRVAVRTELRLRDLGLGRRSTLLRRAAEALAGAPESVLPARAVLLHGFVAASGVATDLLAGLLRRPGALLLLDRPPRPGGGESEAAATTRLAERAATVLEGQGRSLRVAAGPPPAAVAPPRTTLAAFTAVGADAEAREVARRLRHLLGGSGAAAVAGRRAAGGGGAPAMGRWDAAGGGGALEESGARSALAGWGTRPEGLAVVARDLGPYRLALRRHLRRLGVPFSGVGETGGQLPAGRRAAAALDLLRLGPEAPADRWLDAWEGLAPAVRVDLRLALRALGAARLRDVAALRGQAFAAGLALPVRHGLTPATLQGPAEQAAKAGPSVPSELARRSDLVGATGPLGPTAPTGPLESAMGGELATRTGPSGSIELGEPPLAEQPARGGEAAEEPAGESASFDEDGEGREVARARRISGSRLRWGVQAAVRVHDHLLAQPRAAPAAAQLGWLRALLSDLGLGDEAAQPLAAAVADLAREIPGEMQLAAEELRPLLARALGRKGECELGGRGGGVQVLSVAEARGRTFDHLFLLGLNRGLFPRPGSEDPLLPDDLRQVLQRVLPDLALRRDAFDDERHAFGQLLAAAPEVCVSWRVADDDGRPLAASPLVERLLPGLAPVAAPALYPARAAAATRREETAGRAAGPECEAALGGAGPVGEARPADEHAVLAGLNGSRLDVAAVMATAVRAVREEWGAPLLDLDAAAVAAARLRVLGEMDPDLRTATGRSAAAGLGPYFGFVGGAASGRGGHRLYVTHLEALAACPWQLFLGRLLRIERPPDPLGALPGADPLRLGSLVHRVLDRIVKQAAAAAGQSAAARRKRSGHDPEATGGPAGPQGVPSGVARSAASGWDPVSSWDTARGRSSAHAGDPETRAGLAGPELPPTVAVRWPAAEEIERLLVEAAEEVLAADGLVLPGLARALARHAAPFVEAAGAQDWPDAGSSLAVVASEVEGELRLPGWQPGAALAAGRGEGGPAADHRAAGGRLVERAGGRGVERRLHFRADRADLVGGRLRFTDFKTGRPLSEARDAQKRRQKLLSEIRAGQRLQAVAYLLGAGPRPAVGRYLFLRPDLHAASREVALESGDGEASAAFAAALDALLAAWDEGSFFPRLVDAAGRQEPPRCALCAVSEACLRGDSGARRRLHEWTVRVRAPAPSAGPATAAEAALLAVWDLPTPAERLADAQAAAGEPEEGA